MEVPKKPELTPEQIKAQRKAEFSAARNTYIIIFATFFTLCIVAVIMTNKMESEKPGFQAIHTAKPMSFFDKTYMTPKKKP